VAPHDDAQLCECMSDPRARPVPGTSHASPQTVCPYAFWGLNHAITRIVVGRPVKRLKPRPPLAPLSLRPVLYGVADEADELSPPWATPTRDLEDGLIARAGRDQCIRVRNWRAWRKAVNQSKPELVVLLGHPEMRDGKANFIIGKKSRLMSPLVSLGDFAAEMPAPVVLLCGCTSTAPGDGCDGLPGSFIDMGAAAVVSTLTSVPGSQAAAAAGAMVSAMHSSRLSDPTLATALMEARRQLLARGFIVGLLLVAHGELDIQISAQPAPPWTIGLAPASTERPTEDTTPANGLTRTGATGFVKSAKPRPRPRRFA
jgi:CHAT domain